MKPLNFTIDRANRALIETLDYRHYDYFADQVGADIRAMVFGQLQEDTMKNENSRHQS